MYSNHIYCNLTTWISKLGFVHREKSGTLKCVLEGSISQGRLGGCSAGDGLVPTPMTGLLHALGLQQSRLRNTVCFVAADRAKDFTLLQLDL